MAKEAFIHGVLDKDAAFITISRNPETLDDAFAMQKQVIHDKWSLAGQSKSQNKSARSVSFEYPDPLEPSIWNAVPVAKDSNPSVAKLQEELKDLKASMLQMLTMLGNSTASPSTPSNGISAPPAPLSPKPTNFTSNMICYNCKGKGHGYRECPSAWDPNFTPPQQSRSPVRPPTPTATLKQQRAGLNGQNPDHSPQGQPLPNTVTPSLENKHSCPPSPPRVNNLPPDQSSHKVASESKTPKPAIKEIVVRASNSGVQGFVHDNTH